MAPGCYRAVGATIMNEDDTNFDWRVYEASIDLKVQIGRSMPALPAAMEASVNQHWDIATRDHQNLYNGRVFSVDAIYENRLIGHWTEFRRIVAQIRCPKLYATLQLRPLSVCGILLCSMEGRQGSQSNTGIVIGRRAAGSLFQAAVWQLSPAGAVDPSSVGASGEVDWRKQVLMELQEELGVRPDTVHSMQPLCIVEYPGHHALELGVILRCSSNGETIIEAHRLFGNTEYDALRVLSLDEIVSSVGSGGDTLSHASVLFLQSLKISLGIH